MIPEKFTPLKILNKKEKEEILDELEEQFGIKKIDGMIVARGKDRLFLFSGSFTSDSIKNLEELAVIERVGVYFAKKEEKIGGIRLSIEGTQILGEQITKNVFEIPEEFVGDWMKGREILFEDIEKSNNVKLTNKKIGERSEPNKGLGGRGVGGGIEKPRGFIVMKYKNNFLGTGKASENKIGNFIPKSRRLREKD